MIKKISYILIFVLSSYLFFFLTKENRRLKLENKSYKEAVAQNLKDLEKYETEKTENNRRIQNLLEQLKGITNDSCLYSPVDDAVKQLLQSANI